MKRAVCGLLIIAGCLAALHGRAAADGSLPPLPYHYLHPPPALAAGNTPPSRGREPVTVVRGRSQRVLVFTRDGQAGISLPRSAFVVASAVTSIVVTITPVDTPPNLPQNLVVDGNAYRITALARPSNKPVTLARSSVVTLSWPHIPTAIYDYRGGRWRRVCLAGQSTLTSSTISCPTAALGTVAALTTPSNVGKPPPNTPLVPLNPYIPLLAAVAIVAVAAILGYIVSRPDAPSPPKPSSPSEG